MPEERELQNRDIEVVCAGHAAVDIIPRFPGGAARLEDIFRPGRLINVEEAEVCTGGSAPNTGIALKKLGINTALLVRVGDDHFGKIAIDIIERAGIHEAINVVPGENTSYTLVISPPEIDRMFLHSPGANNNFSSADLNEDLLKRTKLFHLGYPPLMRNMFADGGRELAKIFEIAKNCGTTTSLDMAMPDPNSESGKVDWPEILQRTLPFVDIFIPSVEEALYTGQLEKCRALREKAGNGDILEVLDGDDYTELSGMFMEWGVKIIVLKAGHRGYYIRTAHACQLDRMTPPLVGKLADWAGREIWVPAYRVDHIAGATGSGDCSIAGFLAAYLKGESPDRCACLGNSVGCQNLSELSAVGGVKNWDETLAIANNPNRPRLMFDVKSEGWLFDDAKKFWIGPKDTM